MFIRAAAAATSHGAATVAAALASSCVLMALLNGWLLARYAEGQTTTDAAEASNSTGSQYSDQTSCDPGSRRATEFVPPEAACSCHDYCYVAGDCCDGKAPPVSLSPLPPADAYPCIKLTSMAYLVHMITACPSPAVDASLAKLCTTPTSAAPQPDLLMTPVTDRVSGVTYRNIYCARCWGVTSQLVSTWLWKFIYDQSYLYRFYNKQDVSDSSRTSEQLDEKDTTQGTTEPTTTTPTTTTHEPDLVNASLLPLCLRGLCQLVYTPPPELVSVTHNCTRSFIDSCTDFDANEELRHKCANGSLNIYSYGGTEYKNVACLMCSNGGVNPFLYTPLRSNFEVLWSPASRCCIAANGEMLERRAWPLPWHCRGHKHCPSVAMTAYNAPQTLRNLLHNTTLEDSLTAPSACTLANDFQKLVPSINITRATFTNDILSLVVNETTSLCVLCSVRRCTNFTATSRLLNCSVDGQIYHYEFPLFIVEDDVAVACGSDSSKNVSDYESGCFAIPEVVSIVSLSLSEVCLVAFFASFALDKTQRRFPQEFILNQSIAFFLAFLFFLLRPLAGDLHCKVLATAIHYFLVSAFAWTTLFAVQITRVLSPVPLGSSRNLVWRRLASYTLGWILPLVCVSLGLVADAEDLDFKPDYGPPQCFISNPLGSLALFVAPLGIFLLIDIVAYCYMIVRLISIARRTAVARKSHNEKLMLCIKLVLCLGLLWTSGIVAVFTQSQVAYCVFTLFNVWQGAFTFVIFVCKRNTLMRLRRGAVSQCTVGFISSTSVETTKL